PTLRQVDTEIPEVPALHAVHLPVRSIAEGAGTAGVLSRELLVGHTIDARVAGKSDDVGCESADRQVARRMDLVERHLVARLEVHAFGNHRGQVEYRNVHKRLRAVRGIQVERGAVRRYGRDG